MNRQHFDDQLDDLLNTHRTMVRRDIDAAACGTNSDYRRADQAQAAFDESYERFTRQMSQVLPGDGPKVRVGVGEMVCGGVKITRWVRQNTQPNDCRPLFILQFAGMTNVLRMYDSGYMTWDEPPPEGMLDGENYTCDGQ